MAALLTFEGIKGSYVVGLSWRHEDAMPKASDMRLRAIEHGDAKWGVAIKTDNGMIQAGFCEPIEGVKSPKGIRPLAAIVAGAHPQPWMGRYQIGPDLYWYIAVRDGQEVIPDGDQIGQLKPLLQLREQHLTYGEWTEVVGTVDDLIKIIQTTKGHREVLRDVQAKSSFGLVLFIIVLLLIGGGVAGKWKYDEYQAELKRQAELARKRAIAAALAAQRDAQAHILPWTRQPMPSDVLDACASAWHMQALAKAGWELASWHCVADNMTAVSINTTWKRNGGIAAEAPGILSADAQTASDSESLPMTFPPSLPEAKAEKEARLAVWTVAHLHNLILKLGASAAPPPPAPVAGADAPPPPDPWNSMSVTFDFTVAPWLDLRQAFDVVPGLRLTDISYEASSQKWQADGKLYVLQGIAAPMKPNPQPPAPTPQVKR